MPNIENQSKYSTADYLKRNQREIGNRTCRKPDIFDNDYMDYLMGCDTLQRNDDAKDIDPHYDIFLKSLKQEGSLWVVEANEMNALPESYIMEDVSDDGLDQDIGRKKRKVIRGNIEDVLSKFSGPENERKKRIGMTIHPNFFENVQCLDEEPNTASDMQDGSTEKENSKHAEIFGNITKRGQLEADKLDNEYVYYLENYFSVLNDGDCELYSHKDTHTSSMEGNPKFLAHIERSNANEDDSCDCLGSLTEERNSIFRNQLMRVLRKPFDKEEHQMLAADMKSSKPVLRHLELRSGREMFYTTDKDGKSYLEYYPDLRKKLEAADSRKQELNLYRGFFFWIQNLTQEGAFIPWQNEECLAVRPGDK